ncbi:hypothetical protein [Micromonospora sp. NPDC004704]
MIWHEGEHWGTAAELAAQPGWSAITPAMLRNWAARDGLRRAKLKDENGRWEIRYPRDQAGRIDALKRRSGKGRGRRLDTVALVA